MSTFGNNYFYIQLIIVGISHWIAHRQEADYLLPDLTKWAFHYLHLHQSKKGQVPTISHKEILLYLTQPIESLFEQTDIPADLSAYSILDNFPIETEFDLADGIREYMQDTGLDRVTNVQQLIEINDNAAARNLKILLSNRYQSIDLNNEQRRTIELQYVEWRTFFTPEHNIVNPMADGLLLNSLWLSILEGGFYEKAHRYHSRITSLDDNNNSVYFISPHCGLLYRNTAGAFQPITASPDFDNNSRTERRPVRADDYVLKQTHQRRILIPGIPEMRLYDALKTHPNVENVRIYPGVDRYDLRVILQNGMIHGIDVKDHRRPYALEKLLSSKKALPQVDEHEVEELKYDMFIYLVPKSRSERYDIEMHRLKAIASKKRNLFIMTIEEYLRGLQDV